MTATLLISQSELLSVRGQRFCNHERDAVAVNPAEQVMQWTADVDHYLSEDWGAVIECELELGNGGIAHATRKGVVARNPDEVVLEVAKARMKVVCKGDGSERNPFLAHFGRSEHVHRQAIVAIYAPAHKVMA